MTDPLEIDGLVLRLDYLIRTLVNFENDPQTDEIIRLLGEACDELTYAASEAQSTILDRIKWKIEAPLPPLALQRKRAIFSIIEMGGGVVLIFHPFCPR